MNVETGGTTITAGAVYHSEPYSVYIEYIEYGLGARGDPPVEQWRFTASEDDGEDGTVYLTIKVHEIIETKQSGILAVYYRQWITPDGEPAWGSRPKRVIGSIGSLKALVRRRKMIARQALEGGNQ